MAEDAATPDDSAARRVAAIDCGTNSIRLLVADVDPARRTLTDVHRATEIVRLGQGVDKTGKLAPEALDRTFTQLAEYARIVESSRVGAVRMVATSATRDASNAAEFTAGVVRILGVEPGVLTGDEEARLSFAGATEEFGSMADPPQPPHLVLDIGGGSTEFVVGAPGETSVAAVSLNVGCVRMTERHFASDPPSAGQVAAATADIDAALEEADAAVGVARAASLVGLAGSVTAMAAISLNLSSYDPLRTHHARLTAGQVAAVTAQLLTQSREERAAIPSLHPGRVDVIAAGSLILDRVMRRFGFPELTVSEHDILDGIAWSMVS